jgi:hypothetical protein
MSPQIGSPSASTEAEAVAADPAYARVKPAPAGPSERDVHRPEDQHDDTATHRETTAEPYAPGDKIAQALAEAELLLGYAARAGTPLGLEIVEPIAQARAAAEKEHWTADIEGRFYPAFSKLAAAVKPVTAETLASDWGREARSATRLYFKWTLALATIIIPVSIIMFFNTSISNEVGKLIGENDAAVLRLHDQLVNYEATLDRGANATTAAPLQQDSRAAGVAVSDPTNPQRLEIEALLQQVARVNRQLLARSEVLNSLVFGTAADPYDAKWRQSADERRAVLEIDLSQSRTDQGLISQGFEKIAVFQEIRAFASNAQQQSLIIYGAVTTCALPIFYALLGACAFALRSLAAQTREKTYQPSSYGNFARVIIALIAGTVIGLFNNFTQSVSVSPLAIAFIVGYSVEVFFSFLDGFVQTFRRDRVGMEEPVHGAGQRAERPALS